MERLSLTGAHYLSLNDDIAHTDPYKRKCSGVIFCMQNTLSSLAGPLWKSFSLAANAALVQFFSDQLTMSYIPINALKIQRFVFHCARRSVGSSKLVDLDAIFLWQNQQSIMGSHGGNFVKVVIRAQVKGG